MCGIAGLWNLDGRPLVRHELEQLTRTLRHRGPDGEGFFVSDDTTLGLGHRRLSILDLSETGHQPMSYASGRYWITYNGEIYNFLELRQELEALGKQFMSQSDTEVILAAYSQWGESCQLKFNGMWAFAIWDTQKQELFLSRDRFGVKPLHYYSDANLFAFASEMKAFLFIESLSISVNPIGVATALQNPSQVEVGGVSILNGVQRLPGGYSLTISKGKAPQLKRWWNTLDHLISAPASLESQAEEFRRIFLDACRLRARSDVPIATALSGGLDSSSVLCALAHCSTQDPNGVRQARDWQRAFIATFPGTSQDETVYAQQVVEATGVKAIYVRVDPTDVLTSLDDVLFQFEEIYYDIPTAAWLTYREMRRSGVVVSLDGHGGDESLAGYHHHPVAAMESIPLNPAWPFRIKSLQDTLAHMYPDGVSFSAPSTRKLFTNRLTRSFAKAPRLYSVARRGYRAARAIMRSPNKRSNQDPWLRVEPIRTTFCDLDRDRARLVGMDGLNRQLYEDFHFTLLPTILRNFDRCSMAHGVEIRAPFMDWRLVCFAFSLPASSKIGRGYTKLVLREAMRGLLPESIRTRKSKVGFASPLGNWFAGPLRSFVLDSVHSTDFLKSDIWNGPAIRDFVTGSYQNDNGGTVPLAWRYIQAMHLIRRFSTM